MKRRGCLVQQLIVFNKIIDPNPGYHFMNLTFFSRNTKFHVDNLWAATLITFTAQISSELCCVSLSQSRLRHHDDGFAQEQVDTDNMVNQEEMVLAYYVQLTSHSHGDHFNLHKHILKQILV